MAYKQNRSIIAGTSGHRSALKQRMMKSEMKPLPRKVDKEKRSSSDMDAESMRESKVMKKLAEKRGYTYEMEGDPSDQSKPRKLKKTPLKQKGEIVYKNGKKYYKASDGTLHTGQVSDYETEKANDKKAKAKKKKDVPYKGERKQPTYEGTDEYRKEKDIPKKEFKERGVKKGKKSPLKQAKTKEDYMALGFNQKDADKMMADGAASGVLAGGAMKKKKNIKKQTLNVKKGSAADKKSKLTASRSPMKQMDKGLVKSVNSASKSSADASIKMSKNSGDALTSLAGNVSKGLTAASGMKYKKSPAKQTAKQKAKLPKTIVNAIARKQGKSPMKQLKDLRKKDKYVDLDKGADMPVKKGGFGPRKGNVPNPEMQGRSPKPKKKVMKDGPKTGYTITTKDGTKKGTGNWQPANRVKSDAEKKVIAKRKEYNAMTPAQKKASQDKANAKRKAFEATPEYKKRRAEADKKMREANKGK